MFLNPVCHWAGDVGHQAPCVGDLLSLDFTAGPAVQAFPETAAGLAAALGVPTALASSIWLFDEAAGNIMDRVGSTHLTPTNSPLQNRIASGFGDGAGNLTSKKCVELIEGSFATFEAPDSSHLNFGVDESCAFLVVFRGYFTGGQRVLFSKLDPAPTGGDGYYVAYSTAAPIWSYWEFNGFIGSTSSSCGSLHNQGAWHCVMISLNHATHRLYMLSDRGANVPVDISAYAGRSLLNGQKFQIGHNGLAVPRTDAGVQIAYMAAFRDTAAEALGTLAAPHASFWTHRDHISGLVERVDAGGLAAGGIVDYNAEIGVRVHDWASDQIHYECHPSFTHATQLGMRQFDGQAHLVSDSDNFEDPSWTKTNITVSAVAADLDDSPRDLREARKLTSTASPGQMSCTIGIASSHDYTARLFVKRHSSMASDVAGRFYLWDPSGGGALLGEALFTATAFWQEVKFSFTSFPTSGGVYPIVRIDTSGESICVFQVSVSEGDWPLGCWTESIAAAWQDSTVEGSSAAANEWLNTNTGEIYTKVAFVSNTWSTAYTTNGQIVNVYPVGGGNEDRRIVGFNDQPGYFERVCDGAGAFVPTFALVPSATLYDEHVVRLQWDNAVPITPGVYTRLIVDGVVTDGANAGWAIDGTFRQRVVVGGPIAVPVQGMIACVCFWSAPQPL